MWFWAGVKKPKVKVTVSQSAKRRSSGRPEFALLLSPHSLVVTDILPSSLLWPAALLSRNACLSYSSKDIDAM